MAEPRPMRARVHFQHVQGARLSYVYDLEELNHIGLVPETYDATSFLQEGTKIKLGDDNYIVKRISIKIWPEDQEAPGGYGVSLSRVGESFDYNIQIGVFVDNA